MKNINTRLNIPQLLIEATSHLPESRKWAHYKLVSLSVESPLDFFRDIVALLISENRQICVLAYSYILNQIILIDKEFLDNRIISLLEDAYFRIIDTGNEEFTFVRRDTSYSEQSIIELIIRYLIREDSSFINLFFEQMLYQTHPFEVVQLKYYAKILLGINDKLPLVRKLKLAELFGQKIDFKFRYQLEIYKEGQIEFILQASHYIVPFPLELFKYVQQLINKHTAEISERAIHRLASALTHQHISISFQLAFHTYSTTLELLQPSPQLSETTLTSLLILLKQSLASLFNSNLTPTNEHTLQTNILNLNRYGFLTQLFLNTIIRHNKQQHYNKEIIKLSYEIIDNVTSRMDDDSLEKYKDVMVNSSDSSSIIYLLYGTSCLFQVFDYEETVGLLTNGQRVPIKDFTNIYYLFINKYLTFQRHISFENIQSIATFILAHIQYHQNQLLQSHHKDQTNQHDVITKISILISIYIKMGLSSCLRHNEEYIAYFKKKVLYYLVHSFLGIPEIAHQNIFEALVHFITKDTTNITTELSYNFIDLYIEIFINHTSPHSVQNKDHLKNKLQQEILYLMRISMNISLLQKNQYRIKLQSILVDQSTIIFMGDQLLAFYLKVFNVQNRRLLTNGVQNFNNLQQQVEPLQILVQFVIDPVFESLSHDNLKELTHILKLEVLDPYLSKLSSYIENLQNSVKLILELSLHPNYHTFLDRLLFSFINQQSNIETIHLLRQLSFKNRQFQQATNQLLKYQLYLPCILQTLALNPQWNHQSNNIRARVIQTQAYQHAVNDLSKLEMYNLSRNMENMSLVGEENNDTLWSYKYMFLVRNSAVSSIVNQWFIERSN